MENDKILDLTYVREADLTDTGSGSDLQKLVNNGPAALPPNPTANGWSAQAIINQHVKPSKMLFTWLCREHKALKELASQLDDLLAEGTVNAAKYDAEGNEISKAYAHDDDVLHKAGDETITGSKSFGTSGADNSKTLDVYFTVNLRGPVWSNTILPGNTFALGSAEHYWGAAYIDELFLYGTVSDGFHEWTMPSATGTLALSSYVDSEIGKVKDGTYTAKKAQQDEDGNAIKSTYVKKSQIVDSHESTSTTEPLSANQGKVLYDLIAAIQTLLASDDATLDELQEIVTYIKNNKSLIDAVTLNKVNVSDIVDNLTSNVSSMPLSAAQGYTLKGLIDACYTKPEAESMVDGKLANVSALNVIADKDEGKNYAWRILVKGEKLYLGFAEVE